MRYTILVLFLSLTTINCNKSGSSPEPFPVPTGNYTVVVAYRSFIRPASSVKAEDRPQGISIRYPISGVSSYMKAPYCIDSTLIRALKKEHYLNLSDSVLHEWKKIKSAAMSSSANFPPIANSPMLVFSPGFGMTRINYTAILIEIASHGYLVAAIDPPGSGIMLLPDGKALGILPSPGGPDGKVEELCLGASFIAKKLLADDQFKHSIDPNSLAMARHSIGGAVALNIAAYDPGFRAVINLDGYLFGNAMQTGVSVPFLCILQKARFPEGNKVPDSLKRQRSGLWREITGRSKSGSTIVRIEGMMHFDFTDLSYIIPDSVRIKNGGTLPALRGHQLMSRLMLALLGVHLQNKDPEDLGNVIANNKEIEFEFNDGR